MSSPPVPVDCQTDRPSARVIVSVKETGNDILRRAARPSVAEGHEDNFVAVERCSIPASVFADERTVAVLGGKIGACGHGHTQRRHVRAQRVVRYDRRGHQIGPLRFDARIQVLAVIAVGPAIEASVAHRGQVIRNQVGTDFVAFVGDGPQFAGFRFPLQARWDCGFRWRRCDARPMPDRPPRSRLVRIRPQFRFR